MNPKISIIVPLYKVTSIQLQICIDSVLTQSFSNFELLVIDDGSPYDYTGLKQKYESLDSRVHFYRQANSGVSAARNKGVSLAQGDFLVFLDSDDFWDSGFLYKMYSAINDYDLIICGLDEQWFPSVNTCVDKRLFFSTPSQYNYLQYVNFSVNKLFRRNIIEQYHLSFPVGVQLGEDAIFVASYLSHCRKIRCIPDRLYHYVPNASSAIHVYNRNYWHSERDVIQIQWQMFHQYPLFEREEFFMQHWLFEKLKSVLFYYLSNERDSSSSQKIVKEVFYSGVFDPILRESIKENNPYFTKSETATLRRLRHKQIAGVNKIYQHDIIAQKFLKLKNIVFS